MPNFEVMPRDQRHSYHFVSAALRARIEAGEWLPGEQIPTMRAIADEYDVSLATAQKAVGALAEAGVIVVYPGYGAFIPAT